MVGSLPSIVQCLYSSTVHTSTLRTYSVLNIETNRVGGTYEYLLSTRAY